MSKESNLRRIGSARKQQKDQGTPKSFSFLVRASTAPTLDHAFRVKLSSRLSILMGIAVIIGFFFRTFVEPLPAGFEWYAFMLSGIFFALSFVLKRSQKTSAIWTTFLNLFFIMSLVGGTLLVGGVRAPIFSIFGFLPVFGFILGGHRLGLMNMIAGIIGISASLIFETMGLVHPVSDNVSYRALVLVFLTVLSYLLGRSYESLWTKAADTAMDSARMAGLGKLATGVAQEIKDPLNILISESKLISEFAKNNLNVYLGKLEGEISAEDKKHLQDDLKEVIRLAHGIERAGRHADSAASSLLLQARAGHGELQKADLGLMVENNLSFAYNIMRIRNPVGVSVDYLKSSTPKTYCYPRELNRFLLNIFDNAFYAIYEKTQKNMGHHGVIRVRLFESVDYIEFEISDNGIGISKEDLPRIFEPFYSTRKKGEGIGLGLSYTYDVANLHRGSLMVTSAEGKGTTFILRISKSLQDTVPQFLKLAS
ncbi:MAG TPA: HAMP domain-containing sensor histidine kinase [Pseudobdellovibrionaceae bacterium]|nr:HAMP domain-containing sensor histidine kinase [Pseudobdellovibrionaceae bacterium]